MSKIKKYDPTRGERIRHHQLAGLEIIFHKLTLELESYLFDKLSVPFKVDLDITRHHKFSGFLGDFKYPLPIFIFGLNPLAGDSLLILENSFANLLLARAENSKKTKIVVSDRFKINNENYHLIKEVADYIILKLEQGWREYSPVSSQVKKLASHPIKAKIMAAESQAISVKINLSWKEFNTSLSFCFSHWQLDSILYKTTERNVFSPRVSDSRCSGLKTHFENVLGGSHCQLKAVVGELDISEKRLEEAIETGEIIPLSNEIGINTKVSIDKIPVLAGNLGETDGNYSVQISGKYTDLATKKKSEPKQFKPFLFKKA